MNTNQDKYHQIRCEFQEQYKKHIAPFLESKEEEKQKALKANKICTLSSIIIGITFIIIGFMAGAHSKGMSEFSIFLAIVSFACGYVINWARNKRFEITIKSQVMPKVCACFGKLQWLGERLQSAPDIQHTHLIPGYDTSSIDDSFAGMYQNTKFSIYETHYTKINRSSKHSSSETVFNGILLKIEIHKEFSGNTVIRPSSFDNSNTSGLKKTELEDVVFEKIFDVYTTNEIEARYLITPALMERINNIKKVFEANKIYCSFYKQNLYIGLSNSKDYFKICDMNKPLNDYSQFITMVNEIISIYKLIDYLKLTQEKLA